MTLTHILPDMVLEDVTELFVFAKIPFFSHLTDFLSSDYSGNQEKLPKILLNGNNVCMVSRVPIREKSRADKETLVDSWRRGTS